jgi:hypothetical protein
MDDAARLSIFKKDLDEVSNSYIQSVQITIHDKDNIVDNVLNGLISLTKSELESGKIVFRIANNEAIDMDGVTRSVLSKVATQIDQNPGVVMLKKDSETGFLYFDPSSCYSHDPNVLERTKLMYRGLGRLVGLCLRKSNASVTLPINFPITLYRWLLGQRIGISDLEIISPQLVKSFSDIGAYDKDLLESLEFTFSITMNDKDTLEFEPNGRNRKVQIDNRIDYLRYLLQYYLCCYKLHKNHPVEEFMLGVQHLCQRDIFNKLSPVALQLIIEGNHEINIDDWKQNTIEQNRVPSNEGTVQLFWKVVSELSNTDKMRLLCFTTGTTSLPTNGFQDLNPKFTLMVGPAGDRLPKAHTCFHMLIIPAYDSEQKMRDKLLQAIRECDITDFGFA